MDPREHADLIRDDVIIRTERILKERIDELLAEHPGSTDTFPHALLLLLFEKVDPVQYALMRSEYAETGQAPAPWPADLPEAVSAELQARIRPTGLPGASLAHSVQERALAALAVASECGQTDGAHHKAWVIDQMVRALLGDGYEAWVTAYRTVPGDPDDQYSWDEGSAP